MENSIDVKKNKYNVIECYTCNEGRNYTPAGFERHKNTRKHIRNVNSIRQTLDSIKNQWYCDTCNTKHNYTLAGKSSHLKTKKHIKNVNIIMEKNQ